MFFCAAPELLKLTFTKFLKQILKNHLTNLFRYVIICVEKRKSYLRTSQDYKLRKEDIMIDDQR